MGFELFLDCFVRGQPSGVPRDAVRSLFPVLAEESQRDYWTVRYDRANWCYIAVKAADSGDELISSLMVERPCGDIRLFEALLSILKMGSVVLYFPGQAPPLVGTQSALADIPPPMVEALGLPRLVQSAEQILELIRAA
jgi:hypothetical protein